MCFPRLFVPQFKIHSVRPVGGGPMATRPLPLDDVMMILKGKALEREEKLADSVSLHLQLMKGSILY